MMTLTFLAERSTVREPSARLATPREPFSADFLAQNAVAALIAEANLPGKPGLVGPDGARGHTDMDVSLMHRSAFALEPTFHQFTRAGATTEVGQELRDEVGRIGRAGEKTMMEVTGGVNTHRGAIWNLGLMTIAAAGLMHREEDTTLTAAAITSRAGNLAAIRDSWVDTQIRPGASARKRYRVGGAVSEAVGGFPHVLMILAAMGSPHPAGVGYPSQNQQLRGLLTSMRSLDDTCLLHRGGAEGLELVKSSAASLLKNAGPGGPIDPGNLAAFDRKLAKRRLSAGGSADLLACALFLTSILGAEHADD